MNLDKLFSPQSIVIVGASPDKGKVGNVIAKNISKLGYSGEVYFVNPKHKRIFGKVCYKNLAEIEKKIDLAIVAIPAKFVLGEIEKNAKKIKNWVVISAGFSEIGWEGKKREEEMRCIAKKEKINILGPNCLGFIAPKIKLNASFAGGMPKAGGISFVSQSGALAVALLDMSSSQNLGFSKVISVGNEAQLDETELLRYLQKDKNTQAIGMYLEGIKDGNNFLQTAMEVSREKPVVVLKAGRNKKTQKAISSHTGALAGDDEIISVALEKAGVLRARDLEEFLNLLKFFSGRPADIGDRVAVITNAGGVGVLTADAFTGKFVKLAEFGEKTKKKLRGFLPEESSVENPVDLLGDAEEDRYKKALQIVREASEVDSVICALTPQEQTPVEKIADEIIKFKKSSSKTVVTVFVGGEKIEKAEKILSRGNVCNFGSPDAAVEVLSSYFHWKKFSRRSVRRESQVANARRRERVEKIIKKAKKEKRFALYFSESAKIMEMYGITPTEFREVLPGDKIKYFSSSREKSLEFPVALKVDSQKFLHKTETGGLVLGIKNRAQLSKNISDFSKKFPGTRLIVQEMKKKSAEIIIGMKRDPSFGPVVVYGLGGIYAEFFKMVNYAMPPLSLFQIQNLLEKSKLSFLFHGARGQKDYDSEELARIISGVGNLALEIPEIREFDINPLFLYNDGKKASAADIKMIIGKPFK